MAKVSGRMAGQQGATVFVKVMQSPEYVEALKKAGLAWAEPKSVTGLLDTGAGLSALDPIVIASMQLRPRGAIEIHTPSTGTDVVFRDTYDATLVIGEETPSPLTTTVPVISCEFASRGFHALIGRDILNRCVLTYDGPAGVFRLEWPD
jgi:hypothetical protein